MQPINSMDISNYSDFFNYLTDVEKKNSPKNLFFEGDFSLIHEGLRVSIVGSRNVSSEGLKRTEILVKELVSKGVIIVSGMAKGVDTMAHETAIKNGGKTIAVLGTSLDQVYPKENIDLFEKIKKDHLAISQFPKGYPFQKKNFPLRNRTMALISDATIIIEASENSGTRHQGWEALRLGRMVYLLENILNDQSLSWPSKMLSYGAQVLTREELPFLVDEIPHLTMRNDYAF